MGVCFSVQSKLCNRTAPIPLHPDCLFVQRLISLSPMFAYSRQELELPSFQEPSVTGSQLSQSEVLDQSACMRATDRGLHCMYACYR